MGGQRDHLCIIWVEQHDLCNAPYTRSTPIITMLTVHARDDDVNARPRNEIRVTAHGKTSNFVAYAVRLLQEEGCDEIVVHAEGLAVSKAVMVVESVKQQIMALKQVTRISTKPLQMPTHDARKGEHTAAQSPCIQMRLSR